MAVIPTPHIRAKEGDFADIVLMPGDPLRAKFIAETYFENPKLVTDVRNMLGFTGTYKGKRISVMGSGMGMPSMGIYSYELYQTYDVDNIIRIGSAGSYSSYLNLYDLVLVTEAYSLSSYAKVLDGCKKDIVASSEEINRVLRDSASKLNKELVEARVYSSDVFYGYTDITHLHEHKDCMAVEMEAFGLLYNAKRLNKKAACLLTISNSLVTKEETTPEERENNFKDMVEIALETIINL